MSLLRIVIVGSLTVIAAFVVPGMRAQAQSPSLPTINSITFYVTGLERCAEQRATTRPTCEAALGQPQVTWDRDRNGTYQRRDVELALAEYWDGGRLEYVCYDGSGAARFAEECDRSKCLATRTSAECADVDRDGLFAYQETALGTSDSVDDTCVTSADCGFSQTCRRPAAGAGVDYPRSLCLSRTDCPATGCTAFHLESVAQDDRELIAHVYYDYSPEPARALDLRVQIPSANLTLTDARILAGPRSAGKVLSVTQETENDPSGTRRFVRLIVYGTANLTPIPTGAVAELVFAKTGVLTGTVAFSTNASDRSASLAPNPRSRRSELTGDLWGQPVAVGASTNKLLVHYRFDGQPLDAPGAMSETAYCNNAPCLGKALRQATEARRGYLELSALTSEAVTDQAGRFDRVGTHAALPIFPLADTSTSQAWSLWINPNERRTDYSGEQLVMGHNDNNGVLRYGLFLVPQGSTAHSLVFREYPATGQPITTTVTASLPSRAWSHINLNLTTSGSSRLAQVVLNGQTTVTAALSNAIAQCPAATTPPVALENPGERLFVGTSVNQQFGIKRFDAFGTTPIDVLRDTKASLLDPDYNNQVDKVVYVSTQSGNYEVWMADPSGANPKQVTVGFGNTRAGVFVRRPRFSPDGRLVVFESNIYDAGLGDNVDKQVYRIFAVPYLGGKIAAVDGGATPSEQLNYQTLVSRQLVANSWITPGAALPAAIPTAHYSNARFLSNTKLVFTKASDDYRAQQVVVADLGATGDRRYLTSESTLDPVASTAIRTVDLLDARSPAGTPQSVVLARRKAITFESSSNVYRLGVPVALPNGNIEVSVYYDPQTVDGYCWDQNFNYKFDPLLEDLDKSGGTAPTPGDCGLMEATDLSLAYGNLAPASLSPTTPGAPAALDVSANATLLSAPYKRKISFRKGQGVGGGYVSVEVLAPEGGRPIAKNTLLGTLRFVGSSAAQLALRVRKQTVTLERWNQATAGAAWASSPLLLAESSDVLGGALAPDGRSALLNAVQHARPTLVRLNAIDGNAPRMQKLSMNAAQFEGLDWEKYEPYRPCHWLAGQRERTQGELVLGYRGLLDEVKMYSYARTLAAVASEHERGREWLVKRNPGGQLAAARSCSTDTDCPAFELCEGNVCGRDLCGPSDLTSTSCGRGQCTLVTDASASGAAMHWACSVECSGDSQCFSKECYNGPCRFCEANSCLECRFDPAQAVAPGVTLGVMEGCPDGNSFSCEDGSCISECYSFENSQSRYLCTSNEYCQRGRCVAFNWDWADLSPVSFAGAGLASYDDPNLLAAQRLVVANTTHIFEIKGYGASDTAFPPELRVQVKYRAAPFLRPDGSSATDDWFDIGTLLFESEETPKSYFLHAPYAPSAVRLTQVAPAFENPNLGGRGYLVANTNGTHTDPVCSLPGFNCNAAPGTRRRLGYALSTRDPRVEARLAASTAERDRFLLTGEPTIVVTEMRLNQNLLDIAAGVNTICAYKSAGQALPSASDTINFFSVYRRASSAYVVLNCPERSVGTEVSGFVLSSLPATPPPSLLTVTETNAGCYYGATAGPNRTLCYAYEEGPVFDPYASSKKLYGTLDFLEFTSFGY